MKQIELTQIELIELTLNEIRRSASMIESVRVDAAWHTSDYFPEDTVKISNDIQADCCEILSKCRVALREVLEDVANFQNDKDMLCPIDVKIGKIAYDLIYERKK